MSDRAVEAANLTAFEVAQRAVLDTTLVPPSIGAPHGNTGALIDIAIEAARPVIEAELVARIEQAWHEASWPAEIDIESGRLDYTDGWLAATRVALAAVRAAQEGTGR